MLSKKLKFSLLTASVLFSLNALADTGFKVPVHYNIELIDGSDNTDNYSRFSRFVTLKPGKHQIVMTFKDTFKSGSDDRLVQSIDPVVINIEDLKEDQVITFDYKKPRGEDQANTYAHRQKGQLVDNNTGKALSNEEASYFILTSDNGFSIMRDYKRELLSLNRLYAPSYVENADRGLVMTDYGSMTVRAGSEANAAQVAPQQGLTLEPMGQATSAMSTSSANGTAKGVANAASYNNLVNLYNQADDATKLKFVKYVMSH